MTMLKELRYKGTAVVFQILVWLELAHVTEESFPFMESGFWIPRRAFGTACTGF